MNKINLNDLSSSDAKIKYACAKQAIAISKGNPSELYTDFDFFTELLDSQNNILKWTAIQVIGNLSQVDKKKQVDTLLPRIIDFLKLEKLITANNAILALAEIAHNKPEYLDRITKELLKVEHYKFETLECNNIVVGKVLLFLDRFTAQVKDKKEVRAFIKRQITNPRNATKKKAQLLLKKITKI